MLNIRSKNPIGFKYNRPTLDQKIDAIIEGPALFVIIFVILLTVCLFIN